MQKLSISDHSRDVAGLKYIYPVISRRSGGLSIGVNFNINNACNWRCVYCQVPDLTRGTAPAIDFSLLETELRFFLQQIQQGEFYRQFEVPYECQQIKDIAISGNGEPTSAREFDRAIDLIGQVATEFQLLPDCKFVLISNGGLMHQQKVQAGLKRLSHFGGEVWFKIDSGSLAGRKLINNCRDDNDKVIQHLIQSSEHCHTKIQTCLLNFAGFPWHEASQQDFIQLFEQIKQRCSVREVMLYTVARPSLQPEASQISPATPAQMRFFANELEKLGFSVTF